MIDLLQQLFPGCPDPLIDRLIDEKGTECLACGGWTDLASLIEQGAASCSECGARLQLRSTEETQVVDAPPRRFSGAPLGQPHDATLPAPAAPGDGSIPERIGRYVLSKAIGRGGMGVVWRAHDPDLQREVAVKILHAGRDHVDRERFRREARIAASLDHPSIVRTLDVGNAGDDLFIVQEYVPGISLAEKLELWRPTPREAVELMLPLAEGMAYAHAASVIHRDLKPGNVLIHEESGRPRITDFGLARRENEESNLSMTGQLMGTPRYMAPEMLAEGTDVTPAADIYGLGTIFYELLTGGTPPISGESLQQILLNVSQGSIVPAREVRPQIPPPVEAICQACLALDPADRYESAGLLADDLRRTLEDRPISILPPRRPVAGLAGSQVGSVRLERELGTTAQGVLYAGRQVGRGPVLALVLRPPDRYEDEREALDRQIAVLQELSHPNLLPVQGAEHTAEGYTVLVSPHLEVIGLGPSLRAAGAFEQELALAIQRQLLGALDYLHGQGHAHGQLSGASVLLARDGQRNSYVKLIEAGLRRPDAPPREDLFEAAVLLYRMLTGVSPSHGEPGDAPPLRLREARQAYPFDRRLSRTVARALSPDPARRFPTARQFAEALPLIYPPSVLRRAVQLAPLWVLAIYLLFGVLVVQHADGRRTIQADPGRHQLAPGDRVAARGVLQWWISGSRQLPVIRAPHQGPVAAPDLTRYLPHCREAGRTREPDAAMIRLRVGAATLLADPGPVTRGEYQRFLHAMHEKFPDFPAPRGWATPTEAERRLPVVGCGWQEANLYAVWSGKRLPTEREWELAVGTTEAETGPRWEWTAQTVPGAPDHRRCRGANRRDAFRQDARRRDLGFRCVRDLR